MRELLQWLVGWNNWIFLLPLTTGMLFIVAELALGSVVDLDLDADLDVDVDIDVDVDADVDVDVDADADLGAVALLSWLGVGKIPITLLAEIFGISFGASGLLYSAVAHELGAPIALSFAASVIGALPTAILATRLLGGLLAALMPADATTTLRPEAFVGQAGVATSRVDPRAGQVRIDAHDGRPSTVLRCRLDSSTGTLPRGSAVLIVRYDADHRVFSVTPSPQEG